MITIKIEIDLPDEVFKFFNARAIYKDKKIDEDLTEFLKKEIVILQDLQFKEAIY